MITGSQCHSRLSPVQVQVKFKLLVSDSHMLGQSVAPGLPVTSGWALAGRVLAHGLSRVTVPQAPDSAGGGVREAVLYFYSVTSSTAPRPAAEAAAARPQCNRRGLQVRLARYGGLRVETSTDFSGSSPSTEPGERGPAHACHWQ